jgi:hypothetical protein
MTSTGKCGFVVTAEVGIIDVETSTFTIIPGPLGPYGLYFYFSTACRIAYRLGAFLNLFTHDHLFDDTRPLGDYRLLIGLRHFDRSLLEGGEVGVAGRAVHRVALDSYRLVTQAHGLFNRPLDDASVQADATTLHYPLTDL